MAFHRTYRGGSFEDIIGMCLPWGEQPLYAPNHSTGLDPHRLLRSTRGIGQWQYGDKMHYDISWI